MSLKITQSISKHPISKNKRVVDTQALFLNNSDEGEIRLLCTVFELDSGNNRIEGTAKLFTPTTAGEYVDSAGKKKGEKDKNKPGVQKKSNYYVNKPASGSKSLILQLIDMFKEEVNNLDNSGYFNNKKK